MKYLIVAVDSHTQNVLYPSDEKEYEKYKMQQSMIWKHTTVYEYITPSRDKRLDPYKIAIMQRVHKVVSST